MIAACRHGPVQFVSASETLGADLRQRFEHRSALFLAS
jgi:hypothetical protein